MSEPGAFLALWNGIDQASWQAEYEAWHSFEHVPERVGLPGFREALRYRQAGEGGAAPYYFTCYWLDALDALDSPPYQDVFRQPTRWTARMRGHLSRFLRLPCVLEGSHGVSGGSRVATVQLRLQRKDAGPRLDDAVATLVGQGRALSSQWGRYTETTPIPIANAVAADAPQPGLDCVVLLQHLDAQAVAAAAARLIATLEGLATPVRPPQPFELLTHTPRARLAGHTSVRQPARDDLRERFEAGDLT